MSKNDQILVDQIVRQELGENSDYSDEGEFFEFYSCSQVLREYDFTYDEIENGICDGALDGGVDSAYIVINGDLIAEDTAVEGKYKKNAILEFIIIQSKNEKSFGEDSILKLSRVSKNLLDLDFNYDDFKGRYDEKVLSKFDLFRKTYISLITKRPKLSIRYFYISKGIDVHPNVRNQIEDLKLDVSSILTEAEVVFKTIGASELLEIYRKRENEVFTLKLTENPLSSQGKVFISLVRLQDFYNFITDESGKIIRHIFEANVRDYQGKTNVNVEIQETLGNTGDKEDFWWLNNGVTILANDVSAPGGKELVIHNPEIVNGLQTSNEIFRYYDKNPESDDKRNLLVRVIVPEDEESRDKIIRATNSQTPIPKASLRATDSIHRDIEDYLKPRGLYYDRRKNYYKNEGRKRTEIVSLPFLAQCVMAITMQKPDYSRARPSTLLEDNDSYGRLYNRENDVKSYYIASLIGKRVELFLKSKDLLSSTDKNNIKFYMVYAVASFITSSQYPGFRALSTVEPGSITLELVGKSYDIVWNTYLDLGGGDKLAKGKDLIKDVKERVVSEIRNMEL